MLRIYLLTLASVAVLIGANEYCEHHNGKGLLARSGIERFVDRQLGQSGNGEPGLFKLVTTGFEANSTIGGCQ
ncbi:hypothetical protein [Limnoglobus roseus]|uniref:Uncharacterized protein n=1 Tax=Limnoglobus roseus TaxID=2598579 RepID=A0A5C1AG93_9BACT|nr:hypothetical protein [Limnoglobus roseus]QEL16762.1 hypothetical protein PX52LOC_03731 [Limnoglobus roseus]